jgi:hypothetical protein
MKQHALRQWVRSRTVVGQSVATVVRIACFLVFGLGFVVGASAQDPDDSPRKIPRAFDRNAVEPEEEPEVKRDRQPMMNFAMDEQRWAEQIYSSLGGSEAAFEQLHRRRVRLVLNRIELICGISETKREKVMASAELELQRLKADVQTLVSEAPKNPTQEEYHQFYQRIWRLIQTQQAAPWQNQRENGPTSLWKKVLQTQLTADDDKQIKQDEKDRSAFAQEVTRIEVLLQVSRRLGLTQSQREKLELYSQSTPGNWQTFPIAWNSLQQFPVTTLAEILTQEQMGQLKNPLETSDDMQLIQFIVDE